MTACVVGSAIEGCEAMSIGDGKCSLCSFSPAPSPHLPPPTCSQKAYIKILVIVKKSSLKNLLADCGRLLVDCRSTVGRLSSNCRPTSWRKAEGNKNHWSMYVLLFLSCTAINMTIVAFKSTYHSWLGNGPFRLRVVSLTAHVLTPHVDASLKQYITDNKLLIIYATRLQLNYYYTREWKLWLLLALWGAGESRVTSFFPIYQRQRPCR